eukprot:scaffold101473_cov45-Phaeocystis_antarctica.AAC.1
MPRSSPCLVKNSLERRPPSTSFFGGRPSSSKMSARWSSSRLKLLPERGSKSRSPVAASNSTHATDQMSAGVS